jgi:hypothetical protein
MMVNLLRTLRLASWCLAALMTGVSVAQSSQVEPTTKKARTASAPPWRQKTIRFSDEKVILGLPQENDESVTYCSDAGTTLRRSIWDFLVIRFLGHTRTFQHLAERRGEEFAG